MSVLHPERSSRWLTWGLLLVALVLLWGCRAESPSYEDSGVDAATPDAADAAVITDAEPTPCDPLEERPCTCPSGEAGTATCDWDGQWWPCVCNCGDGICDPEEHAASCSADCGFVQLSAQGSVNVARRIDGAVISWGVSGCAAGPTSKPPFEIDGLRDASEIVTGTSHTCGILAGEVYCCGGNTEGQLGNGTYESSTTPVHVEGIGPAVGISAGERFTCALLADGSVSCWGRGDLGQLGDGAMVGSSVPVTVSVLNDAQFLHSGWLHSCAVRTGGEVVCWGANAIGDGTPDGRSTPTAAIGLSDVVQTAGGRRHNCALDSNQRVWCWGLNGRGQLGLGDNDDRLVPVRIESLEAVVSVSAGAAFTCVVTAAGTGYCFGEGEYYNQHGSMESPFTDSNVPISVTGLTQIAQLAGGEFHGCALLQAGTVWCWGNNESRQLGYTDGTIIEMTAVPVPGI